jgi:Cu/Ag efflux pump CusA
LLEGRSVVVYGTLIAALAVVPLFFLEGVAGAFFPSIAVAFLAALGAAMVVALTVTPALSMLLLSRGAREPRDSPLVSRLRSGYERTLSRLVHRPHPVYVLAGVLVLAAVAAAPRLEQSLLPSFKESQLLIRWDGAPGTSLREMGRITSLASSELRSVPGVGDVGAHVGRAVTADQVVGVNSGEIWVNVDPAADYDATLAAVKNVASGYPGLSGHVQTYSNERVREVLPEGGSDLVVRIYGENFAVLRSKAAEVQRDLAPIDGLVGGQVRLPRGEPSLQIKVRLDAARHYGIKPGDVRRAAAALLSGIAVGNLFEEQKVFDVVVWGTPQTRSSLAAVRRLLIDTPSGGHVRLGRVADVRIVPTPTVIRRQAVSRYVDVAANVRGRDPGAVARDVERTLARIDFPLEVHPEVLTAPGQPTGRLIPIGIAVALGILLLLQAAFASWRIAMLCFLTLPIAVAGGLLAALADGGTLSFGSYFGLVAVFGIAARQAVALISRYRRLEHEGEPIGSELVVGGAGERLEPTLMTAVCAALMLLPLVIGGRAAGFEVVHPLAVVVLGGLVTSMLLNLFVLPALYLRFGSSPEAELSLREWLERRRRAWARTGTAPQQVSLHTDSTPAGAVSPWHETSRE